VRNSEKVVLDDITDADLDLANAESSECSYVIQCNVSVHTIHAIEFIARVVLHLPLFNAVSQSVSGILPSYAEFNSKRPVFKLFILFLLMKNVSSMLVITSVTQMSS